MLSEQEIAALAVDLESSRVERKESFKSSKDRIQEAICAFANDLPGHGAPGYVLIGVDDKAGEPTGLAVTDELLTTITSILPARKARVFPARKEFANHQGKSGTSRDLAGQLHYYLLA
jgi:ATP-dependent DNA helicase RecG